MISYFRVIKSIELRQKSSATVHYYNIENGELRLRKIKGKRGIF
jgi:hypothetical protein